MTEPEHRGRDRSRDDDGHGRAARGQARQQVFNRDSEGHYRDRQVDGGRVNGRFSNNVRGRIASAEWHGNDAAISEGNQGCKASFYVTNFPDNMPLFRLRQAFEVCGILTDVYIARHRNVRGQEFGFVRYVNVKNTVKL